MSRLGRGELESSHAVGYGLLYCGHGSCHAGGNGGLYNDLNRDCEVWVRRGQHGGVGSQVSGGEKGTGVWAGGSASDSPILGYLEGLRWCQAVFTLSAETCRVAVDGSRWRASRSGLHGAGSCDVSPSGGSCCSAASKAWHTLSLSLPQQRRGKRRRGGLDCRRPCHCDHHPSGGGGSNRVAVAAQSPAWPRWQQGFLCAQTGALSHGRRGGEEKGRTGLPPPPPHLL